MSFCSTIAKSTATVLLFTSFLSSCDQNSGPSKGEKLFNGRDLSGWKQLTGTADFLVEDEAIVGVMRKGSANSFLVTEQEYGDFILELDVKLEANTSNSGVQLRSHFDPDANNGEGRVYGRQLDVDPTDRAWTGGIYDEGRREWLYTLDLNPEAKTAYKPNEYNHLRIESIGNETRTWVNGVPAAYLIDSLDSTGFIALQVHSIPDSLDGRRVYFKNINIQTENLTPEAFPNDIYIVNTNANDLTQAESDAGYSLLFDGKTSDGWKSARGGGFPEKGWVVNNGVIEVLKSDGGESTNGGDIITEKQYAAFDLSFEFKLTPGANSGIKYYVTLDEQTSGSAIGPEYQILDDERHPDAKLGKDGNRTLASLYDLITSDRNPRPRRPIGEWNQGRIVSAADNKVTYFLNGFKMLEFERGSEAFRQIVAESKYKDWENFGEAEKGHILIQDHGDAVVFRSIKIKELD